MEILDYLIYAQRYEKEICSKIADLFCEECMNFAYIENSDNTLLVPIRTKNRIHFVEVDVKYNRSLSELSEGYVHEFEPDE